jgi:hypothetical protein
MLQQLYSQDVDTEFYVTAPHSTIDSFLLLPNPVPHHRLAAAARLGPEGTASVLRVGDALLKHAATGQASLADLRATFKSMLLKLTRPRPSPSSGCFSPDQVIQAVGSSQRSVHSSFMYFVGVGADNTPNITAHAHQVAEIARHFRGVFFQHWRLYVHCLSQPQAVVEQTAELLIETASVPSFGAAMPEDEWHAAAAAAEAAAVARAEEERAAAAAEAESARVVAEKAAADAAEAARLADLEKVGQLGEGARSVSVPGETG